VLTPALVALVVDLLVSALDPNKLPAAAVVANAAVVAAFALPLVLLVDVARLSHRRNRTRRAVRVAMAERIPTATELLDLAPALLASLAFKALSGTHPAEELLARRFLGPWISSDLRVRVVKSFRDCGRRAVGLRRKGIGLRLFEQSLQIGDKRPRGRIKTHIPKLPQMKAKDGDLRRFDLPAPRQNLRSRSLRCDTHW